MKKILSFLFVAVMFVSCNDVLNEDVALSKNNLQQKSLRAKRSGAYDENYVEWDSVKFFTYRSGNSEVVKNVVVPWLSGSSSSSGVPGDWIDLDYLNPDPSKRKYSRKNGWQMVYTNLMESSEKEKYVFMYNRYVGVLRLFFRKIEPSASAITSSTVIGLGVKGSSSLLNFCLDMPKPISERQNNIVTFYTSCDQFFGGNAGFLPDHWYGMEIECAYDPQSSDSNFFVGKIIGHVITNTTTTGGITGNITGDVTTTYSGGAGGSDLSFSFTKSNTNTITQNVSGAGESIGTAIEEGQKGNKSGFWKDIWNNVKKNAPQIAGKAIKEGVKSILTAGGSLVTKSLGSLAKSIFGISSKPMTSVSKVDLGAKLVLKTNSISDAALPIGQISDLCMPEFETSPNLFHEHLGVWNLRDLPTVYVDMHACSYFYKQNPDKSKSVGNQPKYEYYLAPVDLVINPDVQKEFSVSNFTQDFVIDSRAESMGPDFWDSSSYLAYGAIGDHLLYSSKNGCIKCEDAILPGKDRNFDDVAFFNRFWRDGLKYARELLFCRVSFDLVSKSDGTTYSFSKYFNVKPVQRSYRHENVEI